MQKLRTPWPKMLCSLPIWSIGVCQIGSLFCTLTIGTHAALYLNTVIGLGVTTCGLLSGLKNILLIIFSCVFTQIIDHLLTKKNMSKTNVRKIAGFIESSGQGFCIFLMTWLSSCPILMIILMTTASMLSGASSCGTFSNVNDVSPNFAAAILSVTNALTSIIGFSGPFMVGFINNVRLI